MGPWASSAADRSRGMKTSPCLRTRGKKPLAASWRKRAGFMATPTLQTAAARPKAGLNTFDFAYLLCDCATVLYRASGLLYHHYSIDTLEGGTKNKILGDF